MGYLNKPKASPFNALIARLVRVFSIYIRRRDLSVAGGMCVFCRKRPITDCFHFIPRGNKSAAFDEENAVGSCRICNGDNEENPQPYIDWFVMHRGLRAWEMLYLRGKQIRKWELAELEDMIEIYTKKTEAL